MTSSTRGLDEPETAVCTRYPSWALGCTVAVPLSGSICPAKTDSSVDLPTPFRPTMPTRSPVLILRFTARCTRTPECVIIIYYLYSVPRTP